MISFNPILCQGTLIGNRGCFVNVEADKRCLKKIKSNLFSFIASIWIFDCCLSILFCLYHLPCTNIPRSIWKASPASLVHAGLTLRHWETKRNQRAGSANSSSGLGQCRQDHAAQKPGIWRCQHHHTHAGGVTHAVIWPLGHSMNALSGH